MDTCRICGNASGNRLFTVREMMLGLRDRFEYLACTECGCLQLATPPADWSRYYPSDYYSFSVRRHNAALRLIKRLRARPALGANSVLGSVVVKALGAPRFTGWLKPAQLKWDDAIADIGSGAGQFLWELSIAGFTRLTGIDPHIARDATLAPGVCVLKRSLDEVAGEFDFVMMNHAFEHFAEPETTLMKVGRLLRPGRLLMIRVPVAGKHAWREYGADWVQLDAPRHFFLHTERSIALLAARTGYTVEHVRYDSNALQFWGSEQYRRGIPLRDPCSYLMNRRASPFTRQQVRAYEQHAEKLNAHGDGDQAAFYLRRR